LRSVVDDQDAAGHGALKTSTRARRA
jgi:hypothetical protein